MLLGLGQVAERQERLADVLVGALVLGIDGQCLFVDRNGLRRVAVLPDAVGEPVVGVRVPVVASDDVLEAANRRRVVAPLDRGDTLRVFGVFLHRWLAWSRRI